jgi:hypothetical protein
VLCVGGSWIVHRSADGSPPDIAAIEQAARAASELGR